MFRGNGWVYDKKSCQKAGKGHVNGLPSSVRVMSHESHVALCNPSLTRFLHD